MQCVDLAAGGIINNLWIRGADEILELVMSTPVSQSQEYYSSPANLTESVFE